MDHPADVSEELRAKRIASRRGQAVLVATRRLIGQHGIEGATFDLITQQADVGRGTIHWAFGSKERLLLELLEQDAGVRMETLRSAICSASSVDELLDRLVALVVDFVREPELGVHVLLQELGSVALREPQVGVALAARRADWAAVFGQLLEDKQSAGVLTLVDDPEVVAALLTAFGHGLAIHALLEPSSDLEPLLRRARSSAESLFVRGELASSSQSVSQGPRFQGA